MKIRFKYRFI